MARRRKRLTPRHPPRVLLQSAGSPVWSEHGATGVTVHLPGLVLHAPADPDPGTRRLAERFRGRYLLTGTGSRADAQQLLTAAFGDQLDRHDVAWPDRLVALGHVLRAWGVLTRWR